MKYIKKNPTPQSLLDYATQPGASYKDLTKHHRDIFWELKRSLLKEQGFICCYCGQRIAEDNSQVEHWFPKGVDQYRKMQLDYQNNLIATCDGGKSARKKDSSILAKILHCDAPKENIPIPVNPLTKECEDKFLFDNNGGVIGTGTDAEVTIEILNLSSPILNNFRKAAINSLIQYPPEDWKAEYERLSKKNDAGEYEPFCFVLQQYIERNYGDQLISENKEKSEEKVETMV